MNLCRWMADMGVLSDTYRRAMEGYCESYSNYRRTLETVERIGVAIVSKDKDGTTRVTRNPFSMELHKFKDECFRYLTEFGLTPSSKTRIVAEQPVETETGRFFG